MMLFRVLATAMAVAGVLAIGEMSSNDVIASPIASTTSVSRPVPAKSSPERPEPPISGFSRPRIDLYGNQIDEAVGDYRVDPRGELYERHAPDTAVLKLTSAGA